MEFCHIAPTKYLEFFAGGRNTHLVLAHLIETDEQYVDWYVKEKKANDCIIIMDNSAFEMYKQGRPMYDSKKLITMAQKINADYVVMSDYPGHAAVVTENSAKEMGPALQEAGFKTFFCPQSDYGKIDELVDSYMWALDQPFIDYIGFSILAIPNAYWVEKDNKLQRFLSRWKFCGILKQKGFFAKAQLSNKKLHLLGMLDGPNEIWLLKDYLKHFHSWDSSAAVWLGVNGMAFDNSPTGLLKGKWEKEVDFNHDHATTDFIGVALKNVKYIDKLLEKAYNVSTLQV